MSSGSPPTGSVTFWDGPVSTGTLLGTANLDKFGFFTFTTSFMVVGSHQITAVYSGDVNYFISTSPVITQAIKYHSSTGLTSSLKTSVFGQTVSFTATITGSGAVPTGTVTFRDGLTVIKTIALTGNTAVLTTPDLGAGIHIITAAYSGDDNFMGSLNTVTQTVKKADTKAYITSSLNPSGSGQSITLNAAVSTVVPGAGTPKGTVTFKDGSKTMATKTLDSLGQATYTTSALSSGNHSITVVYSGGDDFNGSTSPVLKQSVTK